MSLPADFVPGALRTPDDIRATAPRYVASRDLVTIPATYDLRSELLPVRNQKSQGACVAFAICAALENFAGNEDHLSPQFIYNCRPALFGSQSEGMYPSQAVKIAIEYGCPLEDAYPYMKEITTIYKIPDKIFEKAVGGRIKSGAEVGTIEEAKSALVQNGPLMLSVPVYDTTPFWREGRMLGGHCMAIVGYNADGFILRNSWGRSWNGNGHIIFPYSDWPLIWECWVMVDDPSVRPENNSKCSFWCFK